MVYTVTITSQGQISIPAKIRRKFGLDKSRRALVSVEDDKITIKPIKDFLDLGGSFKTSKKPLSNDEIHELFAKWVAKDHENHQKEKR